MLRYIIEPILAILSSGHAWHVYQQLAAKPPPIEIAEEPTVIDHASLEQSLAQQLQRLLTLPTP